MHTVPYEEDVTKGYASEVFEPTWKYGAPYLANTAYTLRRGEWSVGLQKAQVGLNDDVTLSLDVLGTALLTPALMGKYRLLTQGDWIHPWKQDLRSHSSGGSFMNLNALTWV